MARRPSGGRGRRSTPPADAGAPRAGGDRPSPADLPSVRVLSEMMAQKMARAFGETFGAWMDGTYVRRDEFEEAGYVTGEGLGEAIKTAIEGDDDVKGALKTAVQGLLGDDEVKEALKAYAMEVLGSNEGRDAVNTHTANYLGTDEGKAAVMAAIGGDAEGLASKAYVKEFGRMLGERIMEGVGRYFSGIFPDEAAE